MLMVENGTYRQVRSKNGCISSKNSTIWRINVDGEAVPILYAHAISDFPKLRTITFKKNDLKQIHAFAFYNLKRLQEVHIEDNNVGVLVNSVFKDFPLHTISMKNNRLKYIDEGAFENLPHLTTLDLSLNQLAEFEANWFLNSPKIEMLTLDDNKLRIVKNEAFKTLGNLRNLSIGHNDLQVIEENAFSGLRNLRSLDVSGNKIKRLQDKTFVPFKRLEFLSLNGNLLMHLSEELLNDLRSLEVLHVHDNPWFCGCYDKINNCANRNDWKLNINLRHCYNTSITTPVCVVTNPPSSKCLNNYDEELLNNYVEHADSRIWYQCPRPTKALPPFLIPPYVAYIDDNGNVVEGLVWEYI